MAFFFYKDQLESPTNKTAQGHLKEIILGELLEVWLGGPKRDIFLTKKKKKILLSSMEKGRFCISCNRHICQFNFFSQLTLSLSKIELIKKKKKKKKKKTTTTTTMKDSPTIKPRYAY